MASLLQLFSLFLLLSLCHSESLRGPRDSVCKVNNKGFMLKGGHGKRPVLDEEKYKVTISLIREKDHQIVDCVEDSTRYIVRINSTQYFKGFIITSTVPGMGYPANFVGKFRKTVRTYSDENLLVACENTISHSDILKTNPVDLKWRTSSANRDVEFLYAIVFSRYVWAANLTTRFPVCKKAECISRVDNESEASGSGALNVTTDIPGSALSESACKLVDKKLTLSLNISIGPGKPIEYKCVTRDRVKQCEGKCTYCDQGCQVVEKKSTKRTYHCETDDPSPFIVQRTILYRGYISEHLKCGCIGKSNSES